MTGDMPDDERIAGLFRAAASEAGAPPPGFDHGDVVATSRRITARRRSAVVGGALAVLVVAGVSTVAVLPRGNADTLSAAAPVATGGTDAGQAARAGQGAAAAAPEAAAGGLGSAGAAGPNDGSGAAVGAEPNDGSGSAGGVVPNDGSGSAGGVAPNGASVPAVPAPGQVAVTGAPLGPGSTRCADRQDPALRALVVQALPEAAGAPAAATTDVCLPGSQRYISLELGGGVLSVGYLPPGTTVRLAPGASSAPTASHGTVLVSPPAAFRDRAPALLEYLAPRL